MKKKVELSATDMASIREGTIGYLTNKGANLYKKDTYYQSVEYYRLASAMGEVHSIANLGYCYLYGRDIEANTSLAIGYFTIAANRGDVDAAYKLGDIYSSDKWGVKDQELSNYYYIMAVDRIINDNWKNGFPIVWAEQLQDYPSLCYALARETFVGGSMSTDIKISYQFLKHAELGYKYSLENGFDLYKESYEGVLKLLKNKKYDSVRKEIDNYFLEEYED